MLVPEGAGEGALRALLAEDPVLLGRELGAPIGVGLAGGGRGGRGDFGIAHGVNDTTFPCRFDDDALRAGQRGVSHSTQRVPSHQRCQIMPSRPGAQTSIRSAAHELADGDPVSSPPSVSQSCQYEPSQ